MCRWDDESSRAAGGDGPPRGAHAKYIADRSRCPGIPRRILGWLGLGLRRCRDRLEQACDARRMRPGGDGPGTERRRGGRDFGRVRPARRAGASRGGGAGRPRSPLRDGQGGGGRDRRSRRSRRPRPRHREGATARRGGRSAAVEPCLSNSEDRRNGPRNAASASIRAVFASNPPFSRLTPAIVIVVTSRQMTTQRVICDAYHATEAGRAPEQKPHPSGVVPPFRSNGTGFATDHCVGELDAIFSARPRPDRADRCARRDE